MLSADNVQQQVRQVFFDSIANKSSDMFYEEDICRVRTSDSWIAQFYEESQSVEGAVRLLIDACIWRKEFGVRDLNADTLPADSLNSGQIFVRNSDRDGYPLLIMRSFMHKAENTPKLKKIFVYWLERSQRESNGKGFSLFFDQQNSGLSNFDLDFLMKFIFPVVQQYYPSILHNIYIYDMPWILTSALRLIKSLLPEHLKKKITVITKSTIHEFIDRDNCLKYWNNGNDDYEFVFVPETQPEQNGGFDGIDRKVHFCATDDNTTQIYSNHTDSSSINSSINENNDPLKITPMNSLKFQLIDDKHRAKVTLYNNSNRTVTFKLKTTSPEKFRVSPSVGIIDTHCTKEIDVFLSDGYFLKHDKFLVTSMFLNDSEELKNFTHLWKTCNDSRKIYEHRMVCEPINMIMKNERIGSQPETVVATNETFQKSVTDQLKAIGASFDELKHKYETRIKRLEYLQIVLIAICVLFVFLWSKKYDAAVVTECDSFQTSGSLLEQCVHHRTGQL